MPLKDSPELRLALEHLFPGIVLDLPPLRPSGQRLVYFCRFSAEAEFPPELHARRAWATWGPCVIKVSEDVHPSVIARLEKEKDLLNSLESPAYPRLFYCDVFKEDPVTEESFLNRLFVTIEQRVDGDPLTSCTSRFNTEAAVSRLLLNLVDGLNVLWSHPQRIVHRDLKPDNVLIRTDDSVVIIDLGIVREEGAPGVTATFLPIGPCTVDYGAPEQLTNQKQFISHKTDFFSLGVIAYELLAGRNPFRQSAYEPPEAVMDRVLRHEPASLYDLGRASREFSDLVQQLLSKEPYRRHRTVDQLRTDLIAVVGDRT